MIGKRLKILILSAAVCAIPSFARADIPAGDPPKEQAAAPVPESAAEQPAELPKEESKSFWAYSEEWFTRRLNVLAFGNVQDPAHSTQNPDNAFLQAPRYTAQLELRPDLIVDTPILGWTFKPRVTATSLWWTDGVMKGEEDRQARFFVNEWLFQPKPEDWLFVSFGKEKQLWGPSFLVSPSNILFKDTEKTNPKSEVEGKYLARLVWLPSKALTVTGIAETQREESSFGEPMRPVRLVKIDVQGENAMASVIGYLQQHERFRIGSYGQWTASDAVVLYYDGILSRGTDALYPALDPANPVGGSFVQPYAASDRPFATVAAGGSYTFLSGETVSLEGLYNGAGYSDAEADAFYALRAGAAGHLFDAAPVSGLSRMTLAQALFPGTPFLRRAYVLAQVQEREIANVLDVMVRYVRSLEERSGQVSTIIEWQATKRLQVFNINTFAVGDRDKEFNSLLSKSFLAGVEMHF
ncbi:MAG: hypothetical protein M0042_14095 [Nitrospiraceae bacterium]|nr:hypothetical protein [Nitrospiraceae bacterium]